MRRVSALLSLSLLFVACSDSGRGAEDAGVGADGGADAASDAGSPDGAADASAELDGGELDGGSAGCAPDEMCGDGLDNDCDTQVEEGCTCLAGESISCFRGGASMREVGACRDGVLRCAATVEFGEWGECEGDVLPELEVCDEAGIDEDCDGAANEDCECFEGEPDVACGSDEGECVAGVQRCVAGARTECEGAVGPAAEICNGLDDDCDGAVDERLFRSCGSDVGACRMGMEMCDAGEWGECLGGIIESDESCDGLDNDCDGETDEMVSRACGMDEGRCVAGVEVCSDGIFGACEGRIDPIAETCNGVDDNCDGETDEGLSRTCGTTDLGVCAYGVEVCAEGVFGSCEGAIYPSPEVCDAARLDENCNGEANEGCGCDNGETRSCGTDEGICVAGTETCRDGRWGTCVGETIAELVEACDDEDDDCDGRVDEGISRVCGTDQGVCVSGQQTCARGAFGACVGEVRGSTEQCDGRDDEDCDGAVDEGCGCTARMTRPCGIDTGSCDLGTQTCTISGTWGACVGETGPSPEVCDGRDDENCNGMVDEGCECTNGATRSCGETRGICEAGTETCSGGRWGACIGAIGPDAAETCDGEDDDCDGRVDEALTRTCGRSTGECETGTQTCAAGSWGTCVGEVGPATELCEGMDDEDCDGAVDNGCVCTEGDTRGCGSSVGVCTEGLETCDLSGSWGVCVGSYDGRSETCDGADEDCDTRVDEGGVCVPPTVMCPADESTTVGTPVMLAASGSDPDGGSVTPAWSVIAAPLGSSATPSPAGAGATSFDPDVAGDYTLRFCVTDDEGESNCCTVLVSAISPCTPPSAPVLTTCGTSWDRRPIIEFTPVPVGVDYDLFVDGEASAYGSVTMTGQNYHRPSSAIAPGSAPPGTSVDIYARACLESDATCCSVSTLVTTSLVESCTTAIPASSSNVLFSEYVTNGDGQNPNLEAGEAIEITNLSHCPVSLDGFHFSYQNSSGSSSSHRWMDFGAADIIPPRGVYVAIRDLGASSCDYDFFGPNDPDLFGLNVSALAMQGSNLNNGWFNNSGGGVSTLRIASGVYLGNLTSGTTLELISPYSGSAGECQSIGFDAYDSCGNISVLSTPTEVLTGNQLGRLWHPCDAVTSPVPDTCLD